MNETITPVTITGAAIITQLSIIFIMAICAVLLVLGDKYTPIGYSPGAASFVLILLILALISLGGLVFSDEFSIIWKPLFGGTIPTVIRSSTALFTMFTMDIICITIMVVRTGGSQISPFSPFFFTLPALAIFLREPRSRIFVYVILISLAFTVFLRSHAEGSEKVGGRIRYIAYWCVSIACFALATFIGLITRPQ